MTPERTGITAESPSDAEGTVFSLTDTRFDRSTRGALYIRSTNPDGFRSEQWAELVDLQMRKGDAGSLCYKIRFVDGVTDEWVVYDTYGMYEFAAGKLSGGD